MKPSRRDLLTLGGGALAGALLTPAPLKMMDDVAIWTQNWSWIPQPTREPVKVVRSACTLCPHGCGLRVRMAGGAPVGLAGQSSHPVSRGALCPLAFGAHQLNWHPQRLRTVLHRKAPSSWTEALAALRRALAEGPVVIVDGRAGRGVSTLFEKFAAMRGGRYALATNQVDQSLQPYRDWTGVAASSLGYDFENVRTVLSFGAPLLDSWGAPGRFARLWSEKAAGNPEPALRLIQVEPELSRTAAGAWRWISVPAGTESALASALARVLVESGLAVNQVPLPKGTLDADLAATGLDRETVQELAQTLAKGSPSLVIAGDGNPAVAVLNVALGAVGARGGILRRNRDKAVASMTEIQGPVRAVLVDSSVPWHGRPPWNAEVFRFAAWHSDAQSDDWLLPAPGFLEALVEAPTSPGSAVETYALAAPLLAREPQARELAEVLNEIEPSLGSAENAIKARCAKIFGNAKGDVVTDERKPLAGMESAEALYAALVEGGVWTGDAAPPGDLVAGLREWPQSSSMLKFDWTGDFGPAVLPPLASKLFQESTLREPALKGKI